MKLALVTVVIWVIPGVWLLLICPLNNDFKLVSIVFEVHPHIPAQHDIVPHILVV